MTVGYIAGKIIVLVLLVVFSLIMSIHDIRTFEIPDKPFYASCFLVTLAQGIFFHQTVFWNILCGLIFVAVYFVLRWITRGQLGMGDVYFGLFQGLCIGLRVIWICLAVETFTGLIAFLILYLVKKEKGIKIPFIPFMSVGLLTAFILEWLVL